MPVLGSVMHSPWLRYGAALFLCGLFMAGGYIAIADEGQPKIEPQLTEAEHQWLAEHSTIRFSVDYDYPPFEFLDRDLNYRGITSDYIAILEEVLGINFVWVQTASWPEGLGLIRERDIDLLPGVRETEPRRAYLTFTHPFVSYPTVVINHGDAPFFSDAAELSGRKVAVVKGFYTQDLLSRFHPDIDLLLADNVVEGLAAVEKGKAFAFVDNLATVSYHIRNEGLTQLKVAARLSEFPLDLSMGVRSDWPEFATILDKVFAAIPQGRKDEIFQIWISHAEPSGISVQVLKRWGLAAVVLLLVIAVIATWRHVVLKSFNYRLQREIKVRKRSEEEKAILIEELRRALANVKTLTGLLPICAHCKKVRDDKGYWEQVEAYVMHHTEAKFSHGICPDCAREHYADVLSEEQLNSLK